jgi:predicted HTH domain antitoxin
MKAHLLEELVDALTAERHITSKGVVEEALLLYLNTNPTLKLDGAVALWRKGRLSLAKAAEVVGLTVPEFKDVLAARGIVRETEGKSAKAMDEKLKDLLP